MNEEEKKAIEFLKENMLDYEEIDTSILLDINSKHKILLNLLEKLQKENEELKDLMAHKNTYTKKLEKDLFENCSNYVISKKIIKAKIEELDLAILECEYLDDDDEMYKKAVREDKVCLLNQKRALQELIEGTPMLALLTHTEEIRQELINKTGINHLRIKANYCPMCGRELKED